MNFAILEYIRRVAQAGGFQDSTINDINGFRFSKTSRVRDEVDNLLKPPEQSVYEISDEKELQSYQNMFAALESRHGKR